MGGRGTFAVGKNVAFRYETVDKIEGVKVLEGIDNAHGLPESSYSSSAYIKLDNNGKFREMRFYDEKHRLYLELAYHLELNENGKKEYMWHYHTYEPSFSETNVGDGGRSKAIKMTDEMIQKYKKYFKGYDL
jgi:hypothetical protein